MCISSRGNDGVITYARVASGGRHRVWICRSRSAGSRHHLWRRAAPGFEIPLVSTGQVQNITPIAVRDAKFRADRTEPIMFSPVDPHTMYYATNCAVQNHGRRAKLADDQSGPDANRSRRTPKCRQLRFPKIQMPQNNGV